MLHHTELSVFLFRFVKNRTEQSYFQFFLYAIKCYITSELCAVFRVCVCVCVCIYIYIYKEIYKKNILQLVQFGSSEASVFLSTV
jgi:hypothetical protein